MAFDFSLDSALVSAIISILVTALFIHFAAKIVVDRSSYIVSILVAVIGTFLGTLVYGLVGDVLGLILGILTWAAVAAVFFRTRLLKGAVIGVVAWLLWFLVNLLIDWLFTRF